MLFSKPQKTAQILPETKIEYRTKTQIKKVYVASGDDKWRRKYCYDVGDWDACKIYTKNLPARARVGRLDVISQY
jgi:hypothetical protein